MLDLHKACYDFVGLQDLLTPYSSSESAGSHPDVIFEGVLVGNFTPKTDLSSKNSGRIDSCWEYSKVFVDVSPD